jgi:DNA-binding response OmpR family regulator
MILLAINSRTVLLQAEHICTQDARQTLSASTLQQARAHLAANPVQAIVLDDWFPDGRGADLLRELREAGSDHVPVISIGSQSIRIPVQRATTSRETGADIRPMRLSPRPT